MLLINSKIVLFGLHKINTSNIKQMDLYNDEFSNSRLNSVFTFDNQTDKEDFDINDFVLKGEIEEHAMTDETGLTPNNISAPIYHTFTCNINKMNPPNSNNKEDEKNKQDECILIQKKRKPVDKNKATSKIKKCGRKTKVSNEPGCHNKYSDDIIIRKIKSKTIKKIIIYINSKIKNKKKYKLLFLSSKQVKNSKVDYNKKLLNKTIKEILSSDISGKYSYYDPQHNKIIIDKLLEEEDKAQRILYESLFNKTLLQCIKHLRGEINIEELEGLGTLNEMILDLNEEDEYKETFKDYFLNFETKLNEKKGRNRKKLEFKRYLSD